MALTASLIRTPFSYEPVNTNGMWIGLTCASTIWGQNDFKYIYSVYVWNNTANSLLSGRTLLGDFRVSPDPTTGNGWFSPHRIIKSRLTNKLYYGVVEGTPPVGTVPYNPNSTLLQADNSAIRYDVDISEECNPNLSFARLVQISPYTNVVVEFNSAHGLYIDDTIRLSKTNPNVNPELNDFVKVTSVISATQAQIDKVPIPSYSLTSDTGKITYQKRWIMSITHSSVDNDYLYGIDAIRTATQSYATNNIPIITVTGSFALTKMKNKKIFLNQYDSCSFIANPNDITNRVDYISIQTFDNSLAVVNTYTFSSYMSDYAIQNANNRIWQVGCGTQDITDITNDTLSGIKYIITNLRLADGTTYESIVREIVDNCSVYPNVRLAFLNSLGGWDMWNFNLLSKRNLNVNRSEFKRTLPFSYNVINGRGNRQYNVQSVVGEEEYTINTDWLTEEEYAYLEELISSPEVYVVNGLQYSQSNDSILSRKSPIPLVTPIIITSKSYPSRSVLNDDLFNLTITYKPAYDRVFHNR